MSSVLIKDTTKEQREQIVRESLGYGEIGCGFEDSGLDYDLYIDGKKELSELSAEYRVNYVKAYPDELQEQNCTASQLNEE